MTTEIPASQTVVRCQGRGDTGRLNTDEPNHAEITVTPHAGEERRDVNARVGLVDSHNIDGDVRSKNLAVSAIGCNTVYGGKRIYGIIARHERSHIHCRRSVTA